MQVRNVFCNVGKVILSII